MAVMEFHRANLLNTTTMLRVDANQTSTAQYLFDKNRRLGFSSSGYNSTTATTISVQFATPTVVSHVFMIGHNIRDYILYYNSATGNSLASSTTNSGTSTYFSFASTTVNSIQIQLNNTIAGSVEKSINELVVTERQYVFERNPPIDDFRYAIRRKQIKHEMPDGGVVLFNVRDKYTAEITASFFSQSSYDTLFGIFDAALPLYFVPFPTTTGWNGQAYECVWSGDFDFRYATNVKSPGFTGTITIEETSAT